MRSVSEIFGANISKDNGKTSGTVHMPKLKKSILIRSKMFHVDIIL
jgi:hypothetical protein